MARVSRLPRTSAALLGALLLGGALALASAGLAGAADALFQDDFSDPSTLGSERYVVREGVLHPAATERPVFRVADGALRLDTHGVRESRCFVMAQAGARWNLDVRIRFPEGERWAGGVTFCDDYRSGDACYFGLYKDPEHCGVQLLGKDLDAWKDVALEAGRWYQVRVSRREGRFTARLDGALVLEKTVAREAAPGAAYQDEPLAHGGFSLASRHMAHPYAIEWDDLVIRGDPAPRAKLLRRVRASEPGATPLEIDVLHYAGDEAWAATITALAPSWLARMEALIGAPPCARTLLYNEQRGAYYDRRGGFNEWGILLEGSAIAGVGGHEESHFWQHLYGEAWVTEGMADFFPALLRSREGKARLRAQSFLGEYRREVEAGSEALKRPLDETLRGLHPTQAGEIPLGMQLGGLKARLFWYVLYRTCGLEALQAMHRRAAAEKKRLKTADVKRILEEITKQDLGRVFAGWVDGEKGRYDLFDAARDGDGDGLCDLDEALLGTDPDKVDTDGDGLADGFEVDHGLDPRSGSDRGKVAAAVAADGLAGEWRGWPALRVDPAGDASGGPDLRSLRARLSEDGSALHLAIGLDTPPAGDWFAQVDCEGGPWDAPGGNRFPVRLLCWPRAGVSDVRVEGKSRDGPLLEWGAIGKAVEVDVPLALLGAPERVTLSVLVGREGDEGARDAFEGAMATVRLRGAGADEPVPDGKVEEWASAPPALEDPAGDAPWDLRALKTLRSKDGRTLHLCALWDGEAPKDAVLQIDVDEDADGVFERRLLFTPATKAVQLWFLDARGFQGDGGIVAGLGKGAVELAIPRSALGAGAKARLAVQCHGGGGTDAAEAIEVGS